MNELPLKIGENGRLSGFLFHDSSLISIAYEDRTRFEIGLKCGAEPLVKLAFQSVSEINFSNVCNGSIISEIFIWNVAAAPANFEVPDNVWNILYRERYGGDVKLMREKAVRLSADNHIALVLCSYGGDIACICSGIIAFLA